MFKYTTAIVLVTLSLSAPAFAGGGPSMPNGTSLNGASLNGKFINGGGTNGTDPNGEALTDATIDFGALPATVRLVRVEPAAE